VVTLLVTGVELTEACFARGARGVAATGLVAIDCGGAIISATVAVVDALVEALRTLLLTAKAAAPAARTPAMERVVAIPTFMMFLLYGPAARVHHSTSDQYREWCGLIQDSSNSGHQWP
jgi:hypothetical protein